MPGEGVLATLRHAWLALEPLKMPMAVIGGLALSAWNHARFTRDADLLIDLEESRLDEVYRAVGKAGFYPRHSPPILQIDDQKIIQLRFRPPEGTLPFQLDLLFAGSEYQKTALARRTAQEIPGLEHPVQVLRPDDLILLKLVAGRIIDRADAAMLLRENRDSIVMAYLNDWIHRLRLADEFAEIWREAFPDEPTSGAGH
jgi:nucleotidyltransferase AbiEii toxin of type IV toxin-antitoxin system